MTKLRCAGNANVGDLKKIIGNNLNMDPSNIMIAILNFRTESRLLENDTLSLHQESVSIFMNYKYFTFKFIQ